MSEQENRRVVVLHAGSGRPLTRRQRLYLELAKSKGADVEWVHVDDYPEREASVPWMVLNESGSIEWPASMQVMDSWLDEEEA